MVVHVSLIMAVGVAEVVCVMATYFICNLCNCPLTTGKQKECTQMLHVAGDENQSRLWNMTTLERENSLRVLNTKGPLLMIKLFTSVVFRKTEKMCNLLNAQTPSSEYCMEQTADKSHCIAFYQS